MRQLLPAVPVSALSTGDGAVLVASADVGDDDDDDDGDGDDGRKAGSRAGGVLWATFPVASRAGAAAAAAAAGAAAVVGVAAVRTNLERLLSSGMAAVLASALSADAPAVEELLLEGTLALTALCARWPRRQFQLIEHLVARGGAVLMMSRLWRTVSTWHGPTLRAPSSLRGALHASCPFACMACAGLNTAQCIPVTLPRRHPCARYTHRRSACRLLGGARSTRLGLWSRHHDAHGRRVSPSPGPRRRDRPGSAHGNVLRMGPCPTALPQEMPGPREGARLYGSTLCERDGARAHTHRTWPRCCTDAIPSWPMEPSWPVCNLHWALCARWSAWSSRPSTSASMSAVDALEGAVSRSPPILMTPADHGMCEGMNWRTSQSCRRPFAPLGTWAIDLGYTPGMLTASLVERIVPTAGGADGGTGHAPSMTPRTVRGGLAPTSKVNRRGGGRQRRRQGR